MSFVGIIIVAAHVPERMMLNYFSNNLSDMERLFENLGSDYSNYLY